MSLDGEQPAIRPSWDAAGIHGNPQPRQWDAVVTVDAPEIEGDRAAFVALAGGDLVVEEGPDDLEPLATRVVTRAWVSIFPRALAISTLSPSAMPRRAASAGLHSTRSSP